MIKTFALLLLTSLASAQPMKHEQSRSVLPAASSCSGSSWNLDSGTIYADCDNNRAGFGTTSPMTPLDVSGAAQFGSGATKSTFAATGALTLADSSALTLSGANGNFVSASSVTGGSFYGDGSNLTGIAGTPGNAVKGVTVSTGFVPVWDGTGTVTTSESVGLIQLRAGSTITANSGTLALSRAQANNDLFLNSNGHFIVGNSGLVNGTSQGSLANVTRSLNLTGTQNGISLYEGGNDNTWWLYTSNNGGLSQINIVRSGNATGNTGSFALQANGKLMLGGPNITSSILNVAGSVWSETGYRLPHTASINSSKPALASNSSSVISLGMDPGWSRIDIGGATAAVSISTTGGTTVISSVTFQNSNFSVGVSTLSISNGNIGVGTIVPAGKIHMSSGSVYLDGSGGPATGFALCLTATGKLTKCTSLVGADGSCTCN